MSYEEEKKELGEWYKQKTHEYLEALDREHLPGLDSPLDALHKQDTKEFNRRLLALKEKYGVE
ncbi:MAG: hypothetical protein LBT08_02855 [Synergistaceae bacterium]|jgi:hypothetical protein|nr:hypothetical protein [Synergistaceae bacterium]